MTEERDEILYIVSIENTRGKSAGHNVIILGSYNTLSEARDSIDQNCRLLANGQGEKLCLYAAPLHQFKIEQHFKDDEHVKLALENIQKQERLLEMANAVQQDTSQYKKSIGDTITQTVRDVLKNAPPNQTVTFTPSISISASSAPSPSPFTEAQSMGPPPSINQHIEKAQIPDDTKVEPPANNMTENQTTQTHNTRFQRRW